MLFLNEPVTSPALNSAKALRGRIPLGVEQEFFNNAEIDFEIPA
jgi:hypothetical protein